MLPILRKVREGIGGPVFTRSKAESSNSVQDNPYTRGGLSGLAYVRADKLGPMFTGSGTGIMKSGLQRP